MSVKTPIADGSPEGAGARSSEADVTFDYRPDPASDDCQQPVKAGAVTGMLAMHGHVLIPPARLI